MLTGSAIRRCAAIVMAVAVLASPLAPVLHANAMARGADCATMTMPGHTAPGPQHAPIPPCCNQAFAGAESVALPAVPLALSIAELAAVPSGPFVAPDERAVGTAHLLPFAQGPPLTSV